MVRVLSGSVFLCRQLASIMVNYKLWQRSVRIFFFYIDLNEVELQDAVPYVHSPFDF